MKHAHLLIGAGLLGIALSASGCNFTASTGASAAMATQATANDATPAALATAATSADAALLPEVLVHKTPTCGCCGAWVDTCAKPASGCRCRTTTTSARPSSAWAFPTARVPATPPRSAATWSRATSPPTTSSACWQKKPAARGLVLPGMPVGSPGMESADGFVQPYTVELVARDGGTRAFASHGPQGE